MTWQELYAISRLLRERADWLFDRNETQLASEGIWGALHYTGRALTQRFGRAAGQSFNDGYIDGYIPGQPNLPHDISLRKRQWNGAHRLHLHFYNSNLDTQQIADNRVLTDALLDEAFAALDSHTV